MSVMTQSGHSNHSDYRPLSGVKWSAPVGTRLRWSRPLNVSQSYPTPAANAGADGVTTVYFAPTKPAGVSDGNWI